MLSPGGSLAAYRATLARLRPLIQAAETVVPGHGLPLPRERALAIAAEDEGYLEALEERSGDAPLPPGRDSPEQRRIHGENVVALG